MEKILIVKYTPRDSRSSTKKLLDYAIEKLGKNVEIDLLDIEKEGVDFFNHQSVESYALRNYMGKELNDEQKKSLELYDNYTQRVLDADKIIVAYPMYNFSMPGAMKTFFDMILQKGKTWDMDESGYVGLCKDKELILISTAGGVYNEGMGTLGMEHNSSLMKVFAGFMGTKYSEVFIQGFSTTDNVDSTLNEGMKKIDEILN